MQPIFGDGRRVLAAVGEAGERGRLCAVLRSLGHRVEAAADGAEGLDKAVHAPPEAALLDVGLPLLNGYQLAERSWGKTPCSSPTAAAPRRRTCAAGRRRA
jgi:CheY-like chemotaxis protein